MRIAPAFLTMTVLAACGLPECPAADRSGPPPLKVVGAHLRTPDGKVARLRGVNLPELEWGQADHLFRSLDVLVDEWKVNFIRLTVSGDRWFGHTKEKKDGGAHYRQMVREFVKRAAAKRCYVLLNLLFLNPGAWLDEGPLQKGQYLVWWNSKMPDDHSVDFWASAAKEFANHPAVLFDLYNEPRDVSWQVWRDGGNLVETHKKASGVKREYHTPGMQKLVDTCRAQGAKNVVVAEGLGWGFDLSGIVKGFALKDPGGNGVAYSTHLYSWTKGDGPRGLDRCVTAAAMARRSSWTGG
jgi:endoglucanase